MSELELEEYQLRAAHAAGARTLIASAAEDLGLLLAAPAPASSGARYEQARSLLLCAELVMTAGWHLLHLGPPGAAELEATQAVNSITRSSSELADAISALRRAVLVEAGES